MKIAVSNLAWNEEENEEVAKLLFHNKIHGIEIAPAKIWKNPTAVTEDQAKAQLAFWSRFKIKIISLQGIMFMKPQLNIFGEEKIREEMYHYLVEVIKLAKKLQAKTIVFGSPKNKKRGNLSYQKATEIAIDFFRQIGLEAQKRKVFFCVEPNPISYGANFLTTTKEVIDLLKKINQSYIRLNLDVSTLYIAKENPKSIIKSSLPYLKHVHINSPGFGPVGSLSLNYPLIADLLKENNYQDWVSIEIIDNRNISHLSMIKNSISFLKKYLC